MERCRDKPGKPTQKVFGENEEKRIQSFNSIISGTMEIYNVWYTRWEKKYQVLPKLITNFDEFEEQFKTHGICNFQRMRRNELKDHLQVADQIWIF